MLVCIVFQSASSVSFIQGTDMAEARVEKGGAEPSGSIVSAEERIVVGTMLDLSSIQRIPLVPSFLLLIVLFYFF